MLYVWCRLCVCVQRKLNLMSGQKKHLSQQASKKNLFACFVLLLDFDVPSYTGLFGWQVHIGYHGNRSAHGNQQGVVVRGRWGDDGREAADLGDPLLHTAGRQASLGVVVPALLHRLTDLSQTLKNHRDRTISQEQHSEKQLVSDQN